jgi:hypothetical protein
MTISELILEIEKARKSGATDSTVVKVYREDARVMSGVIQPVESIEFRSVQCYESDGTEFRNKYFLIR